MKKYTVLLFALTMLFFLFSCKTSKVTQDRLTNTVWATDVTYSGLIGLSFIQTPHGNCSIDFISFGKGAVHRNCNYIIRDNLIFISGRTFDNKDFQITGELKGKDKIELTFFQSGQEIFRQKLYRIKEDTKIENFLLEDLLIR